MVLVFLEVGDMRELMHDFIRDVSSPSFLILVQLEWLNQIYGQLLFL